MADKYCNKILLRKFTVQTVIKTFSKLLASVQTSGVNTRVHEGCHAEVGQDEKEDQSIVERHSGRDYFSQPGAPRDTHQDTDNQDPSCVLSSTS